jgi:hypothetical protein
MDLHYNDARRLAEARALAHQAVAVADEAADATPLVLGWVRSDSESSV